MKKKIFVMGKVYDLAKQEICEIENEVQKDLDKFSAGGIRFKIDITSEKVRVHFRGGVFPAWSVLSLLRGGNLLFRT